MWRTAPCLSNPSSSLSTKGMHKRVLHRVGNLIARKPLPLVGLKFPWHIPPYCLPLCFPPFLSSPSFPTCTAPPLTLHLFFSLPRVFVKEGGIMDFSDSSERYAHVGNLVCRTMIHLSSPSLPPSLPPSQVPVLMQWRFAYSTSEYVGHT